MDKIELFQQYLDNELSSERRDEVENLIRTDPEAHELFEKLRHQKRDLLMILEEMNPKSAFKIPALPEQDPGRSPLGI